MIFNDPQWFSMIFLVGFHIFCGLFWLRWRLGWWWRPLWKQSASWSRNQYRKAFKTIRYMMEIGLAARQNPVPSNVFCWTQLKKGQIRPMSSLFKVPESNQSISLTTARKTTNAFEGSFSTLKEQTIKKGPTFAGIHYEWPLNKIMQDT